MFAFGDFTHEEWLAIVKGPPKKPHWVGEKEWHHVGDEASLASSKDWVEEGVVNSIVDQGQSEACWAHSAAASLESAYAIKTGKLKKLSEQQLCDCSSAGTCKVGGDEDDAIRWYVKHDACSRSSYPFKGRDGSCNHNCHVEVTKGTVRGATKIQGNKDAWKSALNRQPFSMAVHANDLDQFYGSGVLRAGCSGETDHAVNGVGYGTKDGTPYFKVRNSWGSSWGSHGYLYIEQESGHSKGPACIYDWPAYYADLGGSPSPSPSPHPSPHPSPSPSPSPSSCHNYSGWEDSAGYGCHDWEHKHFCTSDGHAGSGWDSKDDGSPYTWYDKYGNNAFDACCACGGGDRDAVAV